MDKYKIVGKLRQLFFGSMAVVMSAGGVVATFLFTFLDTYDSVSSYCNFRAATPTLLSND